MSIMGGIIDEWVADLRSLVAWHVGHCGPNCPMKEKYMEALAGLERHARHPILMSRDDLGRTPFADDVMRAVRDAPGPLPAEVQEKTDTSSRIRISTHWWRPEASVICERCEACVPASRALCWDCGAPMGVV